MSIATPNKAIRDNGRKSRRRRKKRRTEDFSSDSSSSSDSDSDAESDPETVTTPHKNDGGNETVEDVKPEENVDMQLEFESEFREEEENRYLELQAELSKLNGPQRPLNSSYLTYNQIKPSKFSQYESEESYEAAKNKYLSLITSELSDDLDALRKSDDFNPNMIPTLVSALKSGVNMFDKDLLDVIVQEGQK